jgi:ATP-dependent Clp protease adaptor protein ClpS
LDKEEVEGIIETLEEEATSVGFPCRVILYNDEVHTFEEVIVQLIKAVGCTFEQGRSFAFEVHVKGKAHVFSGDLPSCLKVTSVLEEIALHTQIFSE